MNYELGMMDDPRVIAEAVENALRLGTGEGEIYFHPELNVGGGLRDMHNLSDNCPCECVASGEAWANCIPVEVPSSVLRYLEGTIAGISCSILNSLQE